MTTLKVGDMCLWYRDGKTGLDKHQYHVCIVLWVSDDGLHCDLKSIQNPGIPLLNVPHITLVTPGTPTAVDGAWAFAAEHDMARQLDLQKRRAKMEQQRLEDEERQRLGQARVEARNLLAAGKAIEDVVAMTSVPHQVVIELAQSLGAQRMAIKS